MATRIKLPGGTLKIKTYRELRARERDRRIPLWKIGSLYFTWWSNRHQQRSDEGNEQAPAPLNDNKNQLS